MQNEFKCPIGYIEGKWGYYYTRPGSLFMGFLPEAE